ncbi:MAG: hypothetical protein AB3N33_10470 [Puniceicoccaceae bacterium]
MNNYIRKISRLSLQATCLALAFIATNPSVSAEVPVRLFNPEYLEGDCSYHSLTAASDGMIYFTIGTHHEQSAARIYRYNPSDESIDEIGDLTKILGDDPSRQILHGKIHTPLIEDEGYLYFSTHTSSYDGNLPNMRPADGRAPYPGGFLMRYELASGTYEKLAQLQLPNEGIITLTMDTSSDTLYALTWPTGLLLSYNLEEGLLLNWGAVQERGEWGQLPGEWSFICRRLAMDSAGNLFGSTDTGRVWKFVKGQQRPVEYLPGLNVADVAPSQEGGFELLAEPHYFWFNWRTILWNPNTASFWGLQGGSTQLFEFTPENLSLRSVHSLRPTTVSADSRRNPFRTQLGLTLGPDNTLAYLAHAPGIENDDREPLATSVHLVTYAIGSGKFKDHGPLLASSDARVFFAESLELGLDGHLYTVAWVESTDPAKREAVQKARGKAAPKETEEVIYEIQLVQLPKWDDLMN